MNFAALMVAKRSKIAGLTAQRTALGKEGDALVETLAAEARTNFTPEEEARSLEIVNQRAALQSQIDEEQRGLTALEADAAADARATEQQAERTPTGSTAALRDGVISEPRTYSRDNDPKGVMFARDVALQTIFGDRSAGDRLARHMTEETVERAAAGRPLVERAVGTSAFAGLVVPQYLTDMFAPLARAGRPFADAIRHHDLPEKGMTVSLSKLTTGSSVDDQVNEGDTVSETDTDDTLITLPVRTSAGSQSVSRQAVERGEGIDDTIVEDMFRAHDVNRDNKLLNLATFGLSAVATSIAYTDASPTAAELYPKLLAGPAAVEAALLDQAAGDVIAVMHSRRWYWLQSQLTSTWPLFGQPGVAAQLGGTNYGEKYGPGFRGVLPSGTPVIVDNNIATNLGAGTNEDEIYFASSSESHLWEDPNQPLLIKAEQNQAKKLLIDLVVYSYYAFTHTRRAHVQKIAGTGLITPSF